MLDFAKCEQLVSHARDKQSKPVANNTRVERRDENTYALRLHATDIATFHRDGRATVSSGGWRTVTTAQRLDGFVFAQTRARHSDGGVWYVRSEPDPGDPEPDRGWRLTEIPKPFEALDPGPEPTKPAEGCLAGSQDVRTEARELLIREGEHRDGDITLEHCEGYFSAKVQRDVIVGTHYYEQQHEVYHHAGSRKPDIEGAEETKHEWCPHCELFEKQHRAWSEAMNGGGWGRNRTRGYAKMVELLERYGSREAWQEAYLENFRARRAANKAHREWEARNRVLFEDDMEVVPPGYAKRPDLKAIAREERKRKRIDKKKARVNKFVADAIDALREGLPMPSNGDCWYCCLHTDVNAVGERVEPGAGLAWGDAAGADHLDEHIREGYYVPTMFVNAMRERGYKDAGIYMLLRMRPETNAMGGPGDDYNEAARSLRSYLMSRLVPEASGSAPTGAALRETGLQTGGSR